MTNSSDVAAVAVHEKENFATSMVLLPGTRKRPVRNTHTQYAQLETLRVRI